MARALYRAALWCDTAENRPQLVTLLAQTKAMDPEPELQFQPDAEAGYDLVQRLTAQPKYVQAGAAWIDPRVRGHVAALAEMIVVGERAGVAPDKLLQAVSIGSGDSFALRNHGMKAMVPRSFPEKAFPSDYVLKDMDYALEMAAKAGVSPHMAERARAYYQAAVVAGISAHYFPNIIELIDKGEGE